MLSACIYRVLLNLSSNTASIKVVPEGQFQRKCSQLLFCVNNIIGMLGEAISVLNQS